MCSRSGRIGLDTQVHHIPMRSQPIQHDRLIRVFRENVQQPEFTLDNSFRRRKAALCQKPGHHPFVRDFPGMEGLAHRPEDLTEAAGLGAANPEGIDDLIYVQFQKLGDSGGSPEGPGRGSGVPTALVVVVAQAEADANAYVDSQDHGRQKILAAQAVALGNGKDRRNASRRCGNDGFVVVVVEIERMADDAVGQRCRSAIRADAGTDDTGFGSAPEGLTLACDDGGHRVGGSGKRHSQPVQKAFFGLLDHTFRHVFEVGLMDEFG